MPVPPDSGLIGLSVFAQGILLDPAPVAIGLTDAVELQIGI